VKSGEHVLFDAYMMSGPDRSRFDYYRRRLAKLTADVGPVWARFLLSVERTAESFARTLDVQARRPS
jgi:hypothetical protein